MILYLVLIVCGWILPHSIDTNQSCSREESRLVRNYFDKVLIPLYEKYHLSIPEECVFYPARDRFYQHEINTVHLPDDQWLCQYCQRIFSSEHNLDLHFNHRHNDTLVLDDHAVCLADYCPIFRCEVLRNLKFFSRSDRYNKKSMPKKVLNEHQLTILRSRCSSVINQCIPAHIHHNRRMEIQHAMYAELCAYLTSDRYFRLPTDDKPSFYWSILLFFIVLISIALMLIKLVRRSKRRFVEQDDDEFEMPISDETISTATALLSTTPANGIIHLSKSPSAIRHRVRFRSIDDSSLKTSETS